MQEAEWPVKDHSAQAEGDKLRLVSFEQGGPAGVRHSSFHERVNVSRRESPISRNFIVVRVPKLGRLDVGDGGTGEVSGGAGLIEGCDCGSGCGAGSIVGTASAGAIP